MHGNAVNRPVRYYLDTSILIDYYKRRGANGLRAMDLLSKFAREGTAIVVSDLHVKELKRLGYALTEVRIMLGSVNLGLLLRVHVTKAQDAEAERIRQQRDVPKGDALHAVLARDAGAVLVTRDHHFGRLRDIARVVTPEDVIAS